MIVKALTSIFLTTLFLFFCFFTQTHQSFAEGGSVEQKIKNESVNPGDDYKYFFKRLKEKVVLVFLSPFQKRKADYLLNLENVRLAELKHVVDNKDIANIQTASQRYFSLVGELTDFIIKNKLVEQREKTKSIISSHIEFLHELESSYNDTSAEWRFLEDDINSLKSYLSKLEQ